MAVELATAYVTIIPSTKGIKSALQRELSGLDSVARQSGQGIGSRLAAGAKSALGAVVTVAKRTFVTGMAAVGVTAGVALTKGFGRLKALEEADKRLRDMGLSVRDTDKLMQALNDTLTGTPFALDAGATAMSGFVSAGMGLQSIPKVMEMVADAAAFGQAPLNEVADIFQKVQLNGKASAEILNQLQYRGVPAMALLSDALGMTGEEFASFVSEGKLTAELFFEAWEKGAKGLGEQNIQMAGAAKGAGDTVAGAWANMLTALARGGASALAPFYDHFKTVFSSVGGLISRLTTSLGPVWEEFMGPKVSGMVERFAARLDRIDADAVAVKFERFLDSVQRWGQQARDALVVVRDWVGRVVDRIGELLGSDSAKEFGSSTFDRLRDIFTRLADAARDAAPSVRTIIEELAKATARIGISTWEVLLSVLETLTTLLEIVLVPVLDGLSSWMRDNPGLVTAIVAAFTAWKVAMIAVQGVLALFGLVGTAALGWVVLAVAAVVAGLVWAYQNVDWFRGAVDAVGRFLRDKVWPVLKAVGEFIGGVFVGAVRLLAGFWTDVLWPALRAVIDWITGTLWPALQDFGRWLADLFAPIIEALGAVWSEVLMPILRSVGDYISGTLWPILETVATFIGGVFAVGVGFLAEVWSGVLMPALRAVGDVISKVIVPIFQAVWRFIRDRLIPMVAQIAETFIRVQVEVGKVVAKIVEHVLGIPRRIASTVATMWDGITRGISAARDWVAAVIDGIVDLARKISGRIGNVVRSIGDVLVSPFKAAFNGIVRIWNGTVGRLSFTVPDIPGVPGRGRTFTMPRLREWHQGGTLDGRLSGDEVVAKLLRSETVLTDAQIARLGNGIHAARAGGGGVVVQNHFHGPVAGRDAERWLAETQRAAVRRGLVAA